MNLINIIPAVKMILLIGLLIFVHEFGHFIVARMFKIKVEKFCFGLPFGPILYEKKIGDVIYGIHWLFFLGGYVSFPDDNKDNGLPADSPELFKNKPIYQRACVLLAGVSANLITAYLIVIFCCMHWGKLPNNQFEVIVEGFKNSPKTTIDSGIEVGDKLYSINGKPVEYYNELSLVSKASKKFDNKITESQYKKVLNDFISLNKNINENDILIKDQIVILPKKIEEEKIVLSKNEIYGLKSDKKYIELSDDQIKIRNGAENKSKYKINEDIPVKDFIIAISDSYSPIDIVVERNGKQISVKTLYSGDNGLVGLSLSTSEKYSEINGLGDAILQSNRYMWQNTKLIFWSLKLLITGQVPMDKVTSVVAVTKVGSDIIAKSGMYKALLLTAIISLNLAILNLFPIPALDGGHLMFLIIEKIKGRPVDDKVIERFSNIFFYLLIALMIVFIGNDIVSIWIKKIY